MKKVLFVAALLASSFSQAETTYTVEWSLSGEDRFLCFSETTGADPYIVQPFFSGIEAWYFGSSTVVFAKKSEQGVYETVIDTRNIGDENGLPANRGGGFQLIVHKTETHDGRSISVYNHNIAGGADFFNLRLTAGGTGVDPVTADDITELTTFSDGSLTYTNGNNMIQHYRGTDTPDADGENGLLFSGFGEQQISINTQSIGCPKF